MAKKAKAKVHPKPRKHVKHVKRTPAQVPVSIAAEMADDDLPGNTDAINSKLPPDIADEVENDNDGEDGYETADALDDAADVPETPTTAKFGESLGQ
jgi:hypothetical protein